MNAIEAAYQRLIASFDLEPVDCYLDDATETLLALNAARDQMSAASIAALMDEVECEGVDFGSDSHPCVQQAQEPAEFVA